MSTETGTGVKRRDFLKILGATGATTAVVGCSSEKVEKLIPYVDSPDNTVPGVSQYYATTCRECATACGVMAEVRDGRPIKLEGNPEHPLNRGAHLRHGTVGGAGAVQPRSITGRRWCARAGAQAHHVGQGVRTARGQNRRGEEQGAGRQRGVHQSARDGHVSRLPRSVAGGARHAGAPQCRSAGTRRRPLRRISKAYGASWPALDFSAAKLVVSFGADFLDGWGHSVPQQLDWADARAKLEGAPHLVYIGARRSLTGLNADQWIACQARQRDGAVRRAARTGHGRGGVRSVRRAGGDDRSAGRGDRKARATACMAICGVTTADAVECGVDGCRHQQEGRQRRRDDQAGRRITAVTTAWRRTPTLSRRRRRMAAGTVPLAFVRHANPALHDAKGGGRSPPRSRRCRSRCRSAACPTKRRRCATWCCPTITGWKAGAMPLPSPDRSGCSSRRWIAVFDTQGHGRRADRAGQEGSRRSRRVTTSPTIAPGTSRSSPVARRRSPRH